jgi:muramoyltetrapeptide carboxypeptidase
MSALGSLHASGRSAGFLLLDEEIIKPKRLAAGDRVALVSPASATAHRVEIEIVKESLEALGLDVKLSEHLMDRYGYLAGSDAVRAADVNDQFADSEVSGIVAVRGGWGCARILPLLDFEVIRQNPKVLIGYSDITALLVSIFAKTGLVTFHGPRGLGPWHPFTVDYFRRVLMNGEAAFMSNPKELGDHLTQTTNRVQTIYPGIARGRLLGGNLTVLSAIIGSPYVPKWENSILFLEDVGEDIYRIDRMLTQLKLAGILEKIAGFVFGKCTDCNPGRGFGSLTLEQVFDDHIKPLQIPSWHGAMIGHIRRQFVLPEGIPGEIDAKLGTIRLLEPAVL